MTTNEMTVDEMTTGMMLIDDLTADKRTILK
jgi:hypothetical protein